LTKVTVRKPAGATTALADVAGVVGKWVGALREALGLAVGEVELGDGCPAVAGLLLTPLLGEAAAPVPAPALAADAPSFHGCVIIRSTTAATAAPAVPINGIRLRRRLLRTIRVPFTA
jgi:hypothetical protein